MPFDGDPRNDIVNVDEKTEVKPKKLIGVDHSAEKDKSKEKVDEPVLKTIPRPSLPLTQRLMYKREQNKYKN